jgi:hypothetical protein
MNTPSNHRVHHGRDAKYIDRNYGGILIIWDRLFGTYQREEEAPDYGITDPIGTLDPVWGNLVFWDRLVRASRRAPDLRSRIAIWLQGPGLVESFAPSPAPISASRRPERAALTSRTGLYVLANAAIALPALPAMIYFGQQWGLTAQVGLALFLVASTTLLVALLEGRPWARMLEPVRMVALAVGLCWVVPATLQATGELVSVNTADPVPPTNIDGAHAEH